MFVRAAAVSLLALLAVVHTTGQATADHRLRLKVLWPKIYSPHVSGYLYRDELDEEDDDSFLDPEDEDEYLARRRHGRNIVLDLDEDDFEPIYEPPRRKAVKAKPKAKTAVVKKAPAKPQKVAAKVVKSPVSKPVAKTVAVAPVAGKAPVVAKVLPNTAVMAVKPQTVAVKPVPQTVAPKTAPAKVQVASAVPSAGTIGCSKGAEIVSGYGFTSVKPRSCNGATYSFDASRATNAYLIKVAAASGEITDVQKLK